MHNILIIHQGNLPELYMAELSREFRVYSYTTGVLGSEEWKQVIQSKNPQLFLLCLEREPEKAFINALSEIHQTFADITIASLTTDHLSFIPDQASVILRSPASDALPHHLHSLIRLHKGRSAFDAANYSSTDSDRLNHELISSLSHEMRTTVNSISILCRILSVKGSDLPPDIKNYIEGIRSSSGTLTDLLNELLDIAKLRSGKLGFTIRSINLSELCSLFERIFGPIAAEKGLQFEVLQDTEVKQIITDPLRLEQIIRNLVMNALKYTREGFIRIRIEQAADKNISFLVEDSGPGIPEAKQQTIFDRFEQVEDGTTEEERSGSGLGLYICRELTRYLGGEINLHSVPGEGTQFTVSLPLNSTVSLEQHQSKGHIRLTSAAKKDTDLAAAKSRITGTVLIVDDNEIHNVALKEYLGMHVENCLTAATAGECFELIASEEVNYMILDMSLPDAEGESVLSQIREDPETSNLPVIVYTGRSMHSEERAKLNKLADAVVQKGASSYRKILQSIQELSSGHS